MLSNDLSNFELVSLFQDTINGMRDAAGLDEVSNAQRLRLVNEEWHELQAALLDFSGDLDANRAEVLKESIDLIYVLYGLLYGLGVDADNLFRLVHANNMLKFVGGSFNAEGKLVKPEGFTKLTVTEILDAADGK